MSDRIGKLSVLPTEGDPRITRVSDDLPNGIYEEVCRITDECYAEKNGQDSTAWLKNCWPKKEFQDHAAE